MVDRPKFDSMLSNESLRAMARFRNRLVHLYWEVDDELLYGYLQDRLDDFDRFAAAVSAAAT